MTCLTIAWAAARLRSAPHTDAVVALAGFSVHAYVVLAVSVHENHLCGAIPFLALVSAIEKRFVPVLAAVSTIAALDMNLFYGIGVGSGWAVPRTIAGIDVMVPLAAGNIAALAWHAALLWRHSTNEQQRVSHPGGAVYGVLASERVGGPGTKTPVQG
jgi:hypothetical protein